MPTVHLLLRVPVPLNTGGWQWGEHPNYVGCMVREYAYNASECRALVMTYGRWLPTILGRKELGERFTVLAKGPVSGMTLGLAMWVWCPREHCYAMESEYMDGWRPAARIYYQRTGEIIERQTFSASIMAKLTDRAA